MDIPSKFRKDTPHPFTKKYPPEPITPATPSTPYHPFSNKNNIQGLETSSEGQQPESTTSTNSTVINSLNKTPYTVTPFSTPIQTTPSTNSSIFFTPFSSLKKDTTSKRLFALYTPDIHPQSSSSTDKNVHSPPKSSPSISEMKLISEKNFLILTIDDIDRLEYETENKRPIVREWFRNNWFDGNEYIQNNVILRTVFSIFCRLSKENRLDKDLVSKFQSFWNNIVRYSELRPPHKMKKSNQSTNQNTQSISKPTTTTTIQNEYGDIMSDSTSIFSE